MVNSYSYSIYLRDVKNVHSMLSIVFLEVIKFAYKGFTWRMKRYFPEHQTVLRFY